MSYEKAMAHFKNPRKNHYQQCGFHLSSHEKSYSAIAEETAESYYVGYLSNKERVSRYFPESDDAVDFVRSIPAPKRYDFGIFTDKRMLIMKG